MMFNSLLFWIIKIFVFMVVLMICLLNFKKFIYGWLVWSYVMWSGIIVNNNGLFELCD